MYTSNLGLSMELTWEAGAEAPADELFHAAFSPPAGRHGNTTNSCHWSTARRPEPAAERSRDVTEWQRIQLCEVVSVKEDMTTFEVAPLN